MKYTKEQLQGMSDLSLLRTLHESLGFEVYEYEFHGVITIQKGLKVTTAELTPSDIMPLAFEYELNIHKLHYGRPIWVCSSRTGKYIESENPLRAIACCLILVLQEKQK